MYRAFISILLACFAASAQSKFSCEASPEIRKALDALPPASDLNLTFEQRIGPLRALLERYPQDLFVHLRFQDAIRHRFQLTDEWDRAFALYRSRPNDPAMQLLEARLSMNIAFAKAEQMLTTLVEKHPDFAWPHLGLVEISEIPTKIDAPRAEKHLREFVRLCPDALEAYPLFRFAKDQEMLREAAKRLRARFDDAKNAPPIRYYRVLWDLETRTATADTRAEARIGADVKHLQSLPVEGDFEWYHLFRYASELTRDNSFREWAEKKILEEAPASPVAVAFHQEQWRKQNPPPDRSSPREK